MSSLLLDLHAHISERINSIIILLYRLVTFALHGEPFSFMGMLGVVGLCGVMVNDSLVLVDHINQLRKQRPDESIFNIIVEGASDRLRPVLLTTVTTMAGLLPLAYGIGGTDLYMAPIALALGWGLLFATVLTLVLVPCLYMIFHDIGKFMSRIKKADDARLQPSVE